MIASSPLIAGVVSVYIAKGYLVKSDTDFYTIVAKGKPINHLLHLCLTVLSFSLWVWVWLYLLVFVAEVQVMIRFDQGTGKVVTEPLNLTRQTRSILLALPFILLFVTLLSGIGRY